MNKATTATLSGVLFTCVLAIPCYAAESQGDLAGKRIDLTEAAKPEGFVKISIVRGDLSVEGWDKDEVSLVGTLDEKPNNLFLMCPGEIRVLTSGYRVVTQAGVVTKVRI